MGIQLRAFRRVDADCILKGHVGLTFLDFELHRHSRLQELLLHPNRIGKKQVAGPGYQVGRRNPVKSP